jgi:DNA-binding NarL/FixJ family response regulator
VVDVEEFVAALRRVAVGGTVVDPQAISQLVRRRRDPLSSLSTHEREALSLIAEGHYNTAMARRLFVTDAAVGKHDTNRRVSPYWPTSEAVRSFLRRPDAIGRKRSR